MERDVLDREKKFPPRLHFRVLAPGRHQNVDRENDEIGRHDSQSAAREKAFEIDMSILCERREQLATDQITAEEEEKINTDPTPAMDAAGHREAHDSGVVNDNHDNGERTEKIETRLTFAILKARIY